ncbi:hypothetical protein G6L37_06055 [Agrobacterium rubi]|nr:hypothetical protein [Agrobacterium rubi]NTF24924.1 hypothetical protein [Agrobacterium rubi]
MAKVSKTLTTNSLRFAATFADGRKVTGSWSGNGAVFTVEPYDGTTVRRVSGLFALAQMRGYEQNLYNPTQFLEIVVAAAEQASTIETFEEALKDDLEKAFGINMHAPFELETRPETSVILSKKGRGWHVGTKFANGDDFSIAINGRSVSYSMNPPISGLKAQVSKLAFAAAAIHDTEGAANIFAASARRSDSVESWIDNIQSDLTPSPQP